MDTRLANLLPLLFPTAMTKLVLLSVKVIIPMTNSSEFWNWLYCKFISYISYIAKGQNIIRAKDILSLSLCSGRFIWQGEIVEEGCIRVTASSLPDGSDTKNTEK